MLLATGHAEEEEQFAWLASALDDDRPIALFLHKPLCVSRMDEGECGYWTVAPAPRQRIASLLAGKQVSVIASGHLHIQHQQTVEGVNHVWCPTASFVVGASQEDLARLSHRGCGRHGGQMADRQGENRRSMWFIVQDFRRSMSAIWPRPSGSPPALRVAQGGPSASLSVSTV